MRDNGVRCSRKAKQGACIPMVMIFDDFMNIGWDKGSKTLLIGFKLSLFSLDS